jgi:molecular chaperone GrpE (heat shock protein)
VPSCCLGLTGGHGGRSPLARRKDTATEASSAGAVVAAAARDPLLDEIADLVRKSARGQVRVAAKLDGLESTLQVGFAEQRAAATKGSAPSPEALSGWGEVLDALDTIEHVASSVGLSADPSYAQGLRAVAARLEGALAQVAIERVGERGTPVDARVLRVVGTEDHPDLPEGVVTRVVRAAALARGRLVREGEVFVNRRSNS